MTSTPSVATLILPTPYGDGGVNCYLLTGEPLTLIDTGPNYGDAQDALIAGLAAQGVALADVELVLLTHQHSDHTGNAAMVATASSAVVAAHRDVAAYLGDLPAALAREDDYQAQMMLMHGVPERLLEPLRGVSRSFHQFGRSVAVTRPLSDGEVVEAGGRLLRALFRPGHSPSDTIFVDEANAMALLGDHLIADVSSNPVAHLPLAGHRDPTRRPPTLPIYLDSLERTAELELVSGLPGHGEPIADHRGLIASRFAKQRERTERVRRSLEDGPRTAYSIARMMWGEVAMSQAYLTLSAVLGALDVLLAAGAVRELAGTPVRYYELAAPV